VTTADSPSCYCMIQIVHIHYNNLNMHWGAQKAEGYLSGSHILVKYYITGCQSHNSGHRRCLRNIKLMNEHRFPADLNTHLISCFQTLVITSPNQMNIIGPKMKDAGWWTCCHVVNNPLKRYITDSLKDEFLYTDSKSHNVEHGHTLESVCGSNHQIQPEPLIHTY